MRSASSWRFFIWGGVIAVVAGLPLALELALEPQASFLHLAAFFTSIGIAVTGGVWLALRTEDALRRMESAAARFAEGNFDSLMVPPRRKDLRALSEGLNEMAAQLKSRLDALSQLSREQDAILRSMTEGVVTIDSEGRIRRVNDAARTLLGISKGEVQGRLVSEVIRHPDIRKIISEATSSALPKTGTVTLRDDPEVILDVYGSPLFQDDGSSSGTLIVFRDMTRVHKLENVRRDFVANVSHELRTPITSIKGFAETLLEGAMHEPESLHKFLGIIAKHAERLHAIFNDLLTLARLEAGSEDDHVQVAPHRLSDLVNEAIDTCSAKAASKQIALGGTIADDIRVVVNQSLIQQALVNLIDNAIKYSDSGAQVAVSAERQGEMVRYMVTDNGPGIESAHLGRLFERFYRVDQGRSRQMGGTGLGLSIVKHIAQVHGGRVEVQSTLGKGSVFSIFLKTR